MNGTSVHKLFTGYLEDFVRTSALPAHDIVLPVERHSKHFNILFHVPLPLTSREAELVTVRVLYTSLHLTSFIALTSPPQPQDSNVTVPFTCRSRLLNPALILISPAGTTHSCVPTSQ